MAEPVDLIVCNGFTDWFDQLDTADQEKVRHYLELLEVQGLQLPHPYSSAIKQKSRHGPGLKELRVQARGRPLRVFYRFDASRNAIILLGGDKTGHNEDRFYEEAVQVSDDIFDSWLAQQETT